jgi:formylglycine-generating enzyme required for sulfatase activity
LAKIALLLLLFPSAALAAQKASLEAPPGTIYLKGGRTQVGNDVKTIEEMLEKSPSMRNFAGAFVAETPLIREEVDPFFLMVSEVSNEQYATFIEKTQFRPPHLWGEEDVSEARVAYLEENGKLRKAARDAGEKLPEMIPFDDAAWWQQHWQECEWSVPEDAKHMPITFVDYQDARAYARWAGLRLMSEGEYQHAARRGTERVYPWGEDWSEGHCASMEINSAEVLRIASFPDGATEDGLFDLSGNAWEWTTSSYMPYEGYKMQTFKFGRGSKRIEVDAMAKWDPNKRVVVGGSVQSPREICRVTTRRGSDRFQKTSSLGFRCAASAVPGLDRARVILDDIPNEFRPSTAAGPVEYSPELVIAMDQWTTATGQGGESGIALPDSETAADELPPLYQIISGYSYISFIPVTKMPVPTVGELRKATLEGDLVHLGVLSTDQEIVDPPIGAGTWMIAFRGAGASPEKTPVKEGEEGEDIEAPEEVPTTQREQAEEALGFDTAVDTLILFDSLGKPVTSFPADRLEWGNPRKPSVGPVDRVFTVIEEEEEVEYTERWLEFELFISGKGRKGARMVLGLRLGEGVADQAWRKS